MDLPNGFERRAKNGVLTYWGRSFSEWLTERDEQKAFRDKHPRETIGWHRGNSALGQAHAALDKLVSIGVHLRG